MLLGYIIFCGIQVTVTACLITRFFGLVLLCTLSYTAQLANFADICLHCAKHTIFNISELLGICYTILPNLTGDLWMNTQLFMSL